MEIEQKIVNIKEIKENKDNPRKISKSQLERLKLSLQKFPEMLSIREIVVDENMVILGGNMRYRALKELGEKTVPVKIIKGLSEEQKKEFIIKDNNNYGEWDIDLLQTWDIDLLKEWDLNLMDFNIIERKTGKIKEEFIYTPTTVLNTRDKVWQDRRKEWLDLGIQSEIGREDGLIYNGNPQSINIILKKEQAEKLDNKKYSWEEFLEEYPEYNKLKGTSVFDPVLCELMYRWFCIENGKILDPFCGGSVRGVVAGYLGYKYTGIDIREEQITANKKQIEDILKVKQSNVNYILDDARNVDKINDNFDFIFTCPPYFNIEKYSELENDISNINDYNEFLKIYADIIKKAIDKLNSNRFACFVVSNFRDKRGFYYDFVGDTIRIFKQNNIKLYNEAILVNQIGSAPIRINKYMKTRKLVKLHQNVLIFYKDDINKIKELNFKN